jgi:putative transposase
LRIVITTSNLEPLRRPREFAQYCSHDYQKILQQHGFQASMSGKGNCYDNAAAETFFKTINAELIWRRSWETRRQAEMAIFEYINGFYNPRRRHSALGWKSPSLSKCKWLKRALGAEGKRDRSRSDVVSNSAFRVRALRP